MLGLEGELSDKIKSYNRDKDKAGVVLGSKIVAEGLVLAGSNSAEGFLPVD